MSSSNCTYLQETVGPRLRLALASMLVKQPSDCVDYIGRFLLYEEEECAKEEHEAIEVKEMAEQKDPVKEDWLTECKRLTGAKEVYVAFKENDCWHFVEGDQRGSETEGALFSELPLCIDNVLRDDRVNFFGKAPQFGSFAAYPMTSDYGEMALCANTLGSAERIDLRRLEEYAKKDFLTISTDEKEFVISGELNQLRELATRGPPPPSALKLAASLYSANTYWPHVAKTLASFDEATFADNLEEATITRIKEALSQYEKVEEYYATELFDRLHSFLTELLDSREQPVA